MQKKPNFLIVGVPKSGTSSLYEYLKEHPEVFLTEQKELHFFSHAEITNYKEGPGDKASQSKIVRDQDAYLSLYEGVKDEKAIGDISPSYFFFSKAVIPKIKKTLGEDVKIIISLRDPIDRAFSNYMHQRRLQYEKMDFKDAIVEETSRKALGYSDFWRYSEHSLYYQKALDFINAFGKDNVKILLFEALKENTDLMLSEVCQFLGIDETYEFKKSSKIYNQGGAYKSTKLTDFLLKPSPFKEKVQNIIGEKVKQKYRSYKAKTLDKNKTDIPTIDSITLERMKSQFDEDVLNLKKLGVDTSKWRHFKQ